MKRLYLMRHGHAPTTQEAGVAKDSLRPLSDLGRADARRMADELTRKGCAPSLILHSPLLRAVQTADEVAASLKPSPGREIFTALDNTRPAEEVERAITERAAAVDDVLVIGHQPQIGELAVLLGKTELDFHPATIVAIEFESEPRVLWALSPDRAR